jgi:hypothetical protein
MIVWQRRVSSALARAISLLCTLLSIAFLLTSCDDDPAGTDCDGQQISAALHRVLYWGRTSSNNEEPNTGEPSSTILKPLWYAPDHVLVVSQRLSHGQNIPGLYDITINPDSQQFMAYKALQFPYAIQAFDFDAASETFLVLYVKQPFYAFVARAVASGGDLALETVVVDSTWTPLGARLVRGSQAAVVYCLTPPSGRAGFYRFSPVADPADSLLVADDVGPQEAAGFDVTDDSIFYGRTTGSYPYHAELLRYPLDGVASGTTIATLVGEFVSVSVNDDETCALVSRYVDSYEVEPGNRVDLVDLITGKSQQVDIRTRPCNFVIADFATWRPTGGAFAFSAASFSSEGDLFPRELWIRTGVVCQ